MLEATPPNKGMKLTKPGQLLGFAACPPALIWLDEIRTTASVAGTDRFGLGGCVTNGKDQSADGAGVDAAAVAQMTARLRGGVNTSDLAGVLAVWSDDGVLMPPHHPSVHGRSEIERYFGQLFRQTRLTFSFTSSQIHVSGDTALERVEYVASARPAQGGQETRDVGKGLHVYRREPDGSWKLAMDIWNSDTPAGAGE